VSSLPGMSMGLVSHRVSALMRAQWVVVLVEGRVSEQGPPRALLDTGQYLKDLAIKQEILQELEAWPERGTR